MIRDAIIKLASGESLDQAEASGVMMAIMDGEASPAQISAFITALRFKGETIDEIAGLARVMRERALPVRTRNRVVDTCGTGGDESQSFNVSTTAALVVAGAGVHVAKHGNRAMSSRSGSADVLEALGVHLNLSPEAVARCIDEVGIGFMFAQAFHPAMKHAAGPRREIGIRTVFNILGPLTNPAGARHQVIGVASAALVPKIAGALLALGAEHALVVHGQDGIDELSISGPSTIAEIEGGSIREYDVTLESLNLKPVDRSTIAGGTAEENARTLREILAGERGPRRDVVLLNAAAALLAADAVGSLREGIEVAGRSIDSGAATSKLDALIDLSRALAA